MKTTIKYLRLSLMALTLRIAIELCPKDCSKTLDWFIRMPKE